MPSRKPQQSSKPNAPKSDKPQPILSPQRARTLPESFGFAFAGLGHFFSTQRNARIELAAAFLVLMIGVVVGLDATELSVVTVVSGLVIIAEMFNTVIEALVDLATQEWHPLAKVGKDVGAAAVLIVSIVAIAVGLLIYLPHILDYLRRVMLPF